MYCFIPPLIKGPWSVLPVDLLALIEDPLVLYSDKVRIRAVCLSWHLQLPKISRESPWLLQAVNGNVEASHALFNPVDKRFYYLNVPNLLQGKMCKGFSHGWIAYVEDPFSFADKFKIGCNRIYLINPLTRARIELPSRDKYPGIIKYDPYQLDEEYTFGGGSVVSQKRMSKVYMRKFVMSRDPSREDGEDCVIVTMYSNPLRLAYCTLQNKTWSRLSFTTNGDILHGGYYRDVTFHKGKLYALLRRGDVHQVIMFENINPLNPNQEVTLVGKYKPDPSANKVSEVYLVESSDGSFLMIVSRYVVSRYDNCKCPTLYFKVHKIDPINRSIAKLKNIGSDVLLLGFSTPMAISSPNSIGYKGNHIYFTEPKTLSIVIKAEDSKTGVFSLEDGTQQTLSGIKSNPKFLWPLD